MDAETAVIINRFAYALIPLVLTLIGALVALYVNKSNTLLDHKVNAFIAGQIRMYAGIAVRSAEQWLASASGQEKLQHALSYFEGLLDKAGIDVPADQLRVWIEEAVASMREEQESQQAFKSASLSMAVTQAGSFGGPSEEVSG